MALPVVSAVIPCFNTKDCVIDAVESVLGQRGYPVEAVVVDDGSSDGTADRVAETYARDDRVHLIRFSANKGPSAARNAGFQAARGEWIGLLDSDDLWQANRIEVLLNHASEADFIADNILGFDVAADAETGPIYQGLGDRTLNLIDFLAPKTEAEHDFGYLQPLVRKRFLETHSIRYREDVRVGEDLLLNLDILRHGGRALFVDQALYVYAMPVGAVSREASPHSRSTADTGPLYKALTEMLADMRSCLSDKETSAFEARLSLMKEMAPIAAFHRARAKRDILAMGRLVLSEPGVRRRIAEKLFGFAPKRAGRSALAVKPIENGST
ncbi:MAG: glycosyltransferase family 2 protein [Roseibium sp.]|nr:glycosyltransferase family 2 protein [Roseibium sp.]